MEIRNNGIALEMVKELLSNRNLTTMSTIKVSILECQHCKATRIIPEVISHDIYIVGLCDKCMKDAMATINTKEITMNEYILELEYNTSNMYVAVLFQQSFKSDLLFTAAEAAFGETCYPTMIGMSVIAALEELKTTFFGVIVERKYPGLIDKLKEVSVCSASMGKSYGSYN